MNNIYAKKIKDYLPQIYKTYLLRSMDSDQIDQIFSEPKIVNAFNKVMNLVYKGNTFGEYHNDTIKKAINEYEQTTNEIVGFKDESFRYFLHIYRFYTECTHMEIVRGGKYLQDRERQYFKDLSRVCCEAVDNLYIDLKNNNRWWEEKSATTLRRQFMNDKIVLPTYRIQELCRAYLGREIDLKKDLQIDQNKTTPPLNLVRELDKRMEALGFRLVYAWVETVNGKRKIVESLKMPTDNRYFLRRYSNAREDTLQR